MIRKPLRNLLALQLVWIFLIPQSSLNAAEINWFVTNKIDPYDRPIQTTDVFFSCSDRIYAMVTIEDLPKGSQVVVFDWVDPSGRQREHTVHRFRHSGHRQQMWAWLTLHPPRGAIAVRLFNPSFGMQEFIGKWTVKVSLNGKLLGKAEFEVLC